MSQDIVLSLRSSKSSSGGKTSSGKSSSKGTSKTSTTTTSTSHKTGYGKSHHSGTGGSAVWFVIMAIVAVLVVFFGIRLLRKRA